MHYTREQLVHFLKVLSKKNKRTPTMRMLNHDKKSPSPSPYIRRFGSWNAALRACGFKLNVKVNYTKEELIDQIKQLKKELNHIPKTSDLKNHSWVASSSTFRNKFGSWTQALKEAGIEKPKKITSLNTYIKRKKQ